MSHVVKCDFLINDLSSLALAAERLGGQLVRGKTTYSWYGWHVGDYSLPAGRTKEQMGTCEHELVFAGCGYSVGVIKRAEGKPGYDLEYDFFRGGEGLMQKIGESAGLLKQAYAVIRAKRAMAAKGMAVKEKRLPNGQIQLVCNA